MRAKKIVDKSVRKNHLRELDVNGSVTLKLIFNKLVVIMWTGFIHLKIGANEPETDASFTVYVSVRNYR